MLLSALFQGVAGCSETSRGFSRHSWHTLTAPPDLSTPPSAGVIRQQRKEFFLSALFGCRDSGYKSKNTNSDPQEGFAIHCSTNRVYCGASLIHKAAACKWGKTSPKSWRSKRHQHSSCSMSLVGLWAVRCVWYQQTWLENMLKIISVAYFLRQGWRKNLRMHFWMWLFQASKYNWVFFSHTLGSDYLRTR